MSTKSPAKFRVGCSGSGDLITADELFEILIMILPEADVMKNIFIRWISLSEDMKQGVETRLENLITSGAVFPSSTKEINIHKGYSMSRILLRVFKEWSHIQDTLGAPGIDSGFTALPKRLEIDIAVMLKCLEEVLELVVREKSEHRRKKFFSNSTATAMRRDEKKILGTSNNNNNSNVPGLSYLARSALSPKPARTSLSDTNIIMASAGDHIPPRTSNNNNNKAQEVFTTSSKREGDSNKNKITMRGSWEDELGCVINATTNNNSGNLEGDESDEYATGVEETAYDTEEDSFEQFPDDADLVQYFTSVVNNGEDSGHGSSSEDSDNGTTNDDSEMSSD